MPKASNIPSRRVLFLSFWWCSRGVEIYGETAAGEMAGMWRFSLSPPAGNHTSWGKAWAVAAGSTSRRLLPALQKNGPGLNLGWLFLQRPFLQRLFLQRPFLQRPFLQWLFLQRPFLQRRFLQRPFSLWPLCQRVPAAGPLSLQRANGYLRFFDHSTRRSRLASAPGVVGWDCHSLIIKSRDDLRQDQFAAQLLSEFDRVFKTEGLQLPLRPYAVLATCR